MLGSDYPVQLWMRPIARSKTREGSWETSHDIGQSVFKGSIGCLSWGFVCGPQAASCSRCCLATKPSCTLCICSTLRERNYSWKRVPFPAIRPVRGCLNTTSSLGGWHSDNAFKSMHSHQGALETFWQMPAWSVGLNTCTTWHQVSHLQYKLPLGGPWRPFLSGIVVRQ